MTQHTECWDSLNPRVGLFFLCFLLRQIPKGQLWADTQIEEENYEFPPNPRLPMQGVAENRQLIQDWVFTGKIYTSLLFKFCVQWPGSVAAALNSYGFGQILFAAETTDTIQNAIASICSWKPAPVPRCWQGLGMQRLKPPAHTRSAANVGIANLKKKKRCIIYVRVR